jgi:hypothetical protein
VAGLDVGHIGRFALLIAENPLGDLVLTLLQVFLAALFLQGHQGIDQGGGQVNAADGEAKFLRNRIKCVVKWSSACGHPTTSKTVPA